ncbi:F0F1 ATP synthase subunit gamma [Oricola nitratireducens]|jgi:F-type H+-transporting ATPase subunit gamma|uniref:F0F1 ATP synthase subunit gamma n=1 Tax=Oricola nitratireducens TaxID=2775868 RepID=UPI00186851E3|nr:FoF1 ATP synthase subunit gamma [Oricola nitratireducens]
MPHLDEIRDRIANVGQIEGVIVAMRAMAAAHAQEARKHLRAIREHEATVARSMAEALSMAPAGESGPPPRGAIRHLRIVVGAAQGFSGLYNERIVSGALELGEKGENRCFMLVGQRCLSEFAERGITPDWSASMVAHAAEVPALASNIVDALFSRLDSGEVQSVSVVYVDPDSSGQALTVRTLMPFDFSRIERAQSLVPPLTMIDPQLLIARLVEEYVFTEICEALMLGFAAENDARMNAMTRARSNVKHIAQDLQRKFHQARQEETTTEIIELSSGAS